MRRLLGSVVRGDFIILLQTRRIAQNVGNVLGSRFKKVKFLNDFFGDNEWIDFIRNKEDRTTIEQAVLGYYKKKIRGLEDRKRIVEEIRIMKTRPSQLHYHLIFVTNKTTSGSPYMQGVYKLKNLVEQGGQRLVDNAILEVLGRQKPLNAFNVTYSLQLHETNSQTPLVPGGFSNPLLTSFCHTSDVSLQRAMLPSYSFSLSFFIMWV